MASSKCRSQKFHEANQKGRSSCMHWKQDWKWELLNSWWIIMVLLLTQSLKLLLLNCYIQSQSTCEIATDWDSISVIIFWFVKEMKKLRQKWRIM
jgi:hypothetical protein